MTSKYRQEWSFICDRLGCGNSLTLIETESKLSYGDSYRNSGWTVFPKERFKNWNICNACTENYIAGFKND